MLKNFVSLFRIKQWAKNLLVFAAWMFAAKYSDLAATLTTVTAFFSMCCASSGVYIFNDVFDRERDRNHPQKKNRPIASGAFPVSGAVVIASVLIVAALALAWTLTPTCFALVLSYLLVQVAYNVSIKAVPVLDVFVIATGFIIRAVLGASALVVPISGWFLFCTGFLALMLGFAKRRNEFLIQAEDAAASRESLVHYSKPALDSLVVMFATCAAICYGIYTLESSAARAHRSLILTAPFVFYGITRYVLLVFNHDEGGEPADLLFSDWHIIGSVVLFAVTAALALSGLNLPFLEP